MSAKHTPASHPVLRQRMRPYSPEDVRHSPTSFLSERIEQIARMVATLPDRPLTVQQRRDLLLIAEELTRRAEPPA